MRLFSRPATLLALLALAAVASGCGSSGGTGFPLWHPGGEEFSLEDVTFAESRSAKAAEPANVPENRDRASTNKERPNIVLVSVDDLDLQTAQSLPRLQKVMADEGVSFENAFVTNPICCPSRATTPRGQYAHNTSVQGNRPPQGGYEKFHRLGGGAPLLPPGSMRRATTPPTWAST